MLISDPDFLPRILYVLGAGFLLVNLHLFFQYFRVRAPADEPRS